MRCIAAAVLALAALAPCGCRPPSTLIPTDAPVERAGSDDAAAWFACSVGQNRCFNGHYQQCRANGEFTTVDDADCNATLQICDATRGGCIACTPGSTRCSDAQDEVQVCRVDASGWDTMTTCDTPNGFVCRGGDHCAALCDSSQIVGTNIGCEYYAVDLDNAQLGAGSNAASQQYAVVVSNPDPMFTARVRVEINTAPRGMPPHPMMVASAVIPPMDLEVFPLPERQVNCPQAMTDFDTGLGTCLSSQAYHIVSTAPVIAYEFNPLSNVRVFSNDASLLIPTNSLGSDYQVMGWPQTLSSNPPETALNPGTPNELRAFVTVVGTAADTHVHVVPRADVLAGNVLPARGLAGMGLDVTIGPFDVLNLETDGFEADLTGSTVTSDRPVVVFSGSQCSDVPQWFNLNDRRCCCDHLEAQQFPRNTIGQTYVAVHTPNRTPVVRAAGAPVGLVEHEPEFFRVLAVTPGMTHVTTTLPTMIDVPASPKLEFDLAQGEFRTLTAYSHFEINANAAVSVANFMSSQLNTGINLTYPGGDPSFIPMPPLAQWRSSYVFLTPDKYAFDFVSIVAPIDAQIQLDGQTLPTPDCHPDRADGCVITPVHPCPASTYTVWSCQFSYPVIDPSLPNPQNVMPGMQHDGVHVVTASAPVGVIVSGFDLRVSYGYPAGTQLRQLF